MNGSELSGMGCLGDVERGKILALRADDCGRRWRMFAGGRLYSAPRTCRYATGA